MWIATEHGFYSAVENRHDKNTVLVRTRVREDAERLAQWVGKKATVIDSPSADYPHRVVVTKKKWGEFVATAASNIDYDNFKNRVGKHDRHRADVYHDVWAALMKLEKGHHRNRWHHDPEPSLFDEEVLFDDEFIDEDEPWLCPHCDETLVGYYDACIWCGGEIEWEYEGEEVFA